MTKTIETSKLYTIFYTENELSSMKKLELGVLLDHLKKQYIQSWNECYGNHHEKELNEILFAETETYSMNLNFVSDYIKKNIEPVPVKTIVSLNNWWEK